jgi:hypothetical protein
MKNLLIALLFLVPAFTLSGQPSEKVSVLQGLEENRQPDNDQPKTATLKSAARLFGDKNDLTTVIVVIPSGSKVTVLGSDSLYYKVSYDDAEGYIYKRQAIIDKSETPEPLVKPSEPVRENRQENLNNTRQNNQSGQTSRFSYLENKYGTSLAVRINSGKIWKGMSAEMVRDSWGSPLKINRVISGNVIKDEWSFKNTTLYFQDNTLVQWGPAQ